MIDQQGSDLLAQTPPSATSRRRVIEHTAAKAFLWAMAAAVATTVLFEGFVLAIAGFGALSGRLSLSAWVANVFQGTLGHLVVILVLQVPLSFLSSSLWISAVRRQPHLDKTRRELLFGCLIVSIPPAVAFWSFVSSARSMSPDETVATYVTASEVITAGFIYLGVLLPRLIVPGLKQGQLAPTLKSAPEHVR
jgi:hypothetical protein